MAKGVLGSEQGTEVSQHAKPLTYADFAAFFNDVHGKPPFPWQQRLAEQVLRQGAWPKVIDLPTGTGKTAVIDVAVFAMAARPEISPRRIVFVIDRRIVVDQVYRRAMHIRDRIKEGGTETLNLVGERLHEISGGDSLGVASLRGGIPVDNGWTHRPDQPWVIVSTVDQFGSRLLFRGYGVTPGMRPIHAALAGNDCLVIMDEVHLSVPFASTLSSISQMTSGALPRRFEVVEMSATPNNTDDEPFRLDDETDMRGCEELRRRVTAAKEAELVTVKDQDGVPNQVLKILKDVAGNCKYIQSVGIVVNRVRTARRTHQALTEAGYTSHLITGRMRPLDREDVLDAIGSIVDPSKGKEDPKNKLGTGAQAPEEPLENLGSGYVPGSAVVVATQAIEVGADFSFDAMITECAPVDSLRQRFGRLDRRGTYSSRAGSPAPAWIIGLKSTTDTKNPDPVYGEATKITWGELKRIAKERAKVRTPAKKDTVGVGPMDLQGFAAGSSAPKDNAPLLQRTHMEAWVQTNPEPIIQPPLESFLHGMKKRSIVDVSVAWRHDRSDKTLQIVPPRQAESLQVPMNAVKLWLSGMDEAVVADVDQEDAGNPGRRQQQDGKAKVGWVRWNGFDKKTEKIKTDDIRPGDVIIADPSLGGLGGGTWDPASEEPVTDMGDAAQFAHRGKTTLRLDPVLIREYLDARPPMPSDEVDTNVPVNRHIESWLAQNAKKCPVWLSGIIGELGQSFEVAITGERDGKHDDDDNDGKDVRYYILSKTNPNTKRPVVDPSLMDGSDKAGSMIGTGVTLEKHLEGVSKHAGTIARRLNLHQDMVMDLTLAGRLHDIGKVDQRFQAQLKGNDPIDMQKFKEPLAKSLQGIRWHKTYPTRMRHEIASVAMLESNQEILAQANDKDLVLHLIGTHHGWSRPLPPIIQDEEPQKLTYVYDGLRLESDSNLASSRMAFDMSDRFWRLNGRYGAYGLAWLEAILRLADHHQSAEEEYYQNE